MTHRLLFVGSRNRLRSANAEHVFAGRDSVLCDSVGLAPDADVRLPAEPIEWADINFVMEYGHKKKLTNKFGKALTGNRVVTLAILERKVSQHF